MKKTILLLVVTMCIPLILKAQQYTFGGLTYDVISNKVYEGKYMYVRLVNANKNLSGDIIIPEIPGSISNGTIFFKVTELGQLFADGSAIPCPFKDCNSITSVTIPKSVTNIVWNVFRENIANLEAIKVDVENSSFASVDGMLYNKIKTDLLAYPCGRGGDINIPESTINIIYGALNNNKASVMIIPSSVQTIDGFWGLNSLTSIIVDPNNTSFSSIDDVLFNKDKTTLIRYPKKKIGESYVIPNTVTKIDFGSFYECTDLSSVIIPNSVKTIYKYAFNSSGLTKVSIPLSVSYIGDAALECENLSDIYFFWQVPPTLLFYNTTVNDFISPFSSTNTFTVHVPKDTKATYKLAEIWKDLNIVDDAETGIKNVTISAINIVYKHSSDIVSISNLGGNEKLYLYNINGHLLSTYQASAETENISVKNLPVGVYIIKVNNIQALKWIKK